MPADVRSEHERELARLARACGCEEGALGSVALLVLVVWRSAIAFTDWSLSGIASIAGQLFLAFVVGGLLGKIVGLTIARARLRALCGRIERHEAPVALLTRRETALGPLIGGRP